MGNGREKLTRKAFCVESQDGVSYNWTGPEELRDKRLNYAGKW